MCGVWSIVTLFVAAYFFFLRVMLFGDGEDEGDSPIKDYIAIGVPIVIASIITFTQNQCRVPTAKSKAWKEVNAVLVEESNAKKTVSFHLKDDLIQEIDGRVDSHGGHIYTRNRYEPYIECNPVHFTVPLGGADAFHTNPNSIPVNHTEANKTVKERLAELDEVKELFSNEEYERKKKSILDSI
jgi:hypothetical protein